MHSGINYVTPNERHQRNDIIKLQARKIVYEKGISRKSITLATKGA